MEENVIEFRDVTKDFGSGKVLDGLTFSVKRGEVVCITGPSGTGKSVTLKHIVGLIEPDSGEIELRSDKIGYLFQSGALLAWLTVWENVALPLKETTRLSDDEIEAKVGKALEAVELVEAADRYPSEISGGMQKRAGLARAIVCDADVILYDEPTSGLDPVTSVRINDLIKRLNVDYGITSIVVTHDIPSALRIADRMLLIKGGRAVEYSTPAEFGKSANPDVREFLAAMKGESV